MKVGADDYLTAQGQDAFQTLLGTAWAFDPARTDAESEVWWHLRNTTKDTTRQELLKTLSTLASCLAKMNHLDTARILEAFKEQFNLKGKDLSALEKDIKAARKLREARGKNQEKKEQRVSDLQECQVLHPAIDFLEGAMTLGFRITLPDGEQGLVMVLSDGQGVKDWVSQEEIEVDGQAYRITGNCDPPFINDTWGLDKLKAFLEHPTKPQNLFVEIKEALRQYLDLPEPAFGLLAAWIVGTFFAHLFTAYPFLHPYGPKETGKSKTLEALRCICFNAWKGRDISVAALGDTVEGMRGTMLIDQAENLHPELVGLLADSYKKAGGKRRVVVILQGGRRQTLEFNTYGPKAFASTKPLDPDLADRCIRIPMTRTLKKLPDLEGWEPIWPDLRDKLYRFTLGRFKEVKASYKSIPGDGTRLGELWRPLGAVLQILKVKQEEIEAIRTLFLGAVAETRHELTNWELALFEVLKSKAESSPETFEMVTDDILQAMGIEGELKPGPKWLGDTLSRFNLVKKRLPRRTVGRKKVQPYLFESAWVIKLYQIYLREGPGNNPSGPSTEENTNNTNEFNGHG